jgi:predicted Zn-dependent protease
MPKYQNAKYFFINQEIPLLTSNYPSIKHVYPSHLGIVFIGKISTSILTRLDYYINKIFNSFFYEILFIEELEIPPTMYENGIRKEHNLLNQALKKVTLQPTDKLYYIINNLMKEHDFNVGLGLTNLPIYSSTDENLLFLFGESNINYKCAIVSTHNLIPHFSEELGYDLKVRNRIIKEAIHEIGHIIIGLDHCLTADCVMRFSKNIEEIDNKSVNLCKKCKSRLNEVRLKNNF